MLDLGIAGRKAIVCAASKGLGRACAMALARAGVAVTITARTAETLEQTAADIRRETGAQVTAVAGDITSEAGRQAALAACPEPDILVNNAGGPPHGDFRDWGIEDWQKAVNANMLTPIMLIKATVDGMCARKFGRIVNITSASVKLPLTRLDISSGARAGLTAFLAGPARQVAEHGVTINHILPGTFATTRFREVGGNPAMIAAIPAKRAGEPEELGRLCAYLCSVHAGYITGQSIVIDGGRYPGVL